MDTLVSIGVILVGILLVTVAISGNYTEPFHLIGITLPGTETGQSFPSRVGA